MNPKGGFAQEGGPRPSLRLFRTTRNPGLSMGKLMDQPTTTIFRPGGARRDTAECRQPALPRLVSPRALARLWLLLALLLAAGSTAVAMAWRDGSGAPAPVIARGEGSRP